MSSAGCPACLSDLLRKPPASLVITDDTQVCMCGWFQAHKQSDENISIAQPEVLSFFLHSCFSFGAKHYYKLKKHSA